MPNKNNFKKIFFLLLFFINGILFSQNKEEFRLLFLNSDVFYFNAIIHQGDIVFGSDIGAISFKNKTPYIIDNEVKGPIKILNDSFEKGYIRYNNFYNYLLPSSYKGLNTSHVLSNNVLYVICKGDLFAFKASSFKLNPYPSVRSISKNFIGTYGGIFSKDSFKLNFPSFTGGQIREYDSITILNWGGLSLIKNGYQEDFYNTDVNVGGIEINDLLFGKAVDSYEIKHPFYILSTSKGLYKFNSNTKEILLLQKALKSPYQFIRGEKDKYASSIIYLHNNKELYEYFVEDNSLNKLVTKDEIIDVYSNSASEFYILTDDHIEYFSTKITRKNKVLVSNLVNVNNVYLFKNFVLLTSDQGLDLLDLNSNMISKNVIKDELNYNAIYNNGNEIQLGGVNGIYELTYPDLLSLFAINKPKIKESNQYIIPITIGSFIALLLTILTITIIRQTRIIKNQQTLESLTTKDKIEAFIRLNIQNVNVELICETFDLPVNALYKTLGNIKPGEIIRKERLKIVRRMRKEMASEEKIAKASGFSLSYLKKI